ncbi:Uncharacterised protein [Mycobacteroides abscessus subsp. abscessus]|nr:Uncharacterised protein [Mycobacteroides abscessus subsp. abscessus]
MVLECIFAFIQFTGVKRIDNIVVILIFLVRSPDGCIPVCCAYEIFVSAAGVIDSSSGEDRFIICQAIAVPVIGIHKDQDSSFFYLCFITAGLFFRDAHADQCACKSACPGANRCPGQCCSNRARRNDRSNSARPMLRRQQRQPQGLPLSSSRFPRLQRQDHHGFC